VTENEQKQQLSVAYVHAVAAVGGYTCQVEIVDDDSVDVVIGATGRVHHQAVLRSPRLAVQLKATSTRRPGAKHLTFPLKRKNYQDLRERSLIPRILMVLVLPGNPREWIEMTEECMISRRCAYWISLLGMPERDNASSVSVRLPRSQRFDVEQLQELMQRVSREVPL
jgi:Domain of unknown function (DUF4365)